MYVIALTTLLAVAPPTGLTVSVERVALLKTGTDAVRITVDPLRAQITVRGAKLTDKAGQICPNTSDRQGAMVLSCTTRSVWAALDEDKAGLFLDVRQLRGVSPFEQSLLLRHWPLSSVSIPDTCPGTQPGARGECALIDGNYAVAKAAFTEALGGADTNLARVRLGDMALRDGDIEGALARYAKVSFAGPIGRLAKARTCDLTGLCTTGLDAQDVSDTTSLPEPMKTEFELFMLRRQVVANQVDTAMAYLAKRITETPSLCQGVTSLCQHLVLAGLVDADEATRINALSAYMSDEVRYGPLKSELALAAGAAAEKLGAPTFAAAVLSSVSPTVAPAELDAHLLKVAQLFLAGRDRVRSGFILEYADGRLGRRTSKPWQAIRKGVNAPTPTARANTQAVEKAAAQFTKLSADVELSTELARAAALRGRAVAKRTEGNDR